MTVRPMYDYDAEYRRLRAAGLQGGAGDQRERNLVRMVETPQWLERDHFPKPPAGVLELGCESKRPAMRRPSEPDCLETQLRPRL